MGRVVRTGRAGELGAGLSARHRVAVILALLGVVLALRTFADEPTAGVSFLSLIPVLLAAYWFGRVGGVAAGLAAVAFYLVGTVIQPQAQLALAVALRLAIFCSVGWVFARLLEERGELAAAVRERDRELDDLRALREALTPAQLPERPDLDVASVFVPADGGVAGDFFLVAPGPGDATIVVVGDVVGKGVEAARRASFVRAALSTFAQFTDDPCRLLEMANASLIERGGTSEVFVTAACAALRPGEGSMAWALAGHPAPVWLDQGTSLNGVRPGLPLGLGLDLNCQTGTVALRPGAGVLLYTDGLSEARRRPAGGGVNAGAPAAGDAIFGVERMAEILSGLDGQPPDEVVSALRRAAEAFSGGDLSDDLCIVALRVGRHPTRLMQNTPQADQN